MHIEVTPQEIQVDVTPQVIIVEVADPSKVGPPGPTIVSAEINDNDNLEFTLSNGQTVTVTDFQFSTGNLVTATSQLNLSAGRAVALSTNNELIYADNTVNATAFSFYGMTTTSGTEVTVLTQGIFTDVGLSLIPDEPVFLSTNGTFTQVPPINGYSLVIGSAITADKFLIHKVQPVFLV